MRRWINWIKYITPSVTSFRIVVLCFCHVFHIPCSSYAFDVYHMCHPSHLLCEPCTHISCLTCASCPLVLSFVWVPQAHLSYLSHLCCMLHISLPHLPHAHVSSFTLVLSAPISHLSHMCGIPTFLICLMFATYLICDVCFMYTYIFSFIYASCSHYFLCPACATCPRIFSPMQAACLHIFSFTEGGVQTPPKFRRPSKAVPNSTQLWKLLKVALFRMPTPQDIREEGSEILKLPPVHSCFTLAIKNKLVVIIKF